MYKLKSTFEEGDISEFLQIRLQEKLISFFLILISRVSAYRKIYPNKAFILPSYLFSLSYKYLLRSLSKQGRSDCYFCFCCCYELCRVAWLMW